MLDLEGEEKQESPSSPMMLHGDEDGKVDEGEEDEVQVMHKWNSAPDGQGVSDEQLEIEKNARIAKRQLRLVALDRVKEKAEVNELTKGKAREAADLVARRIGGILMRCTRTREEGGFSMFNIR